MTRVVMPAKSGTDVAVPRKKAPIKRVSIRGGLSSSAALIAAIQLIPNQPIKLAMSCMAPAIVEFGFIIYVDRKEAFAAFMREKSIKKEKAQKERLQKERIALAEKHLADALKDDFLSESEKVNLKKSFASGKAALARSSIDQAFSKEFKLEIEAISFSEGSTK